MASVGHRHLFLVGMLEKVVIRLADLPSLCQDAGRPCCRRAEVRDGSVREPGFWGCRDPRGQPKGVATDVAVQQALGSEGFEAMNIAMELQALFAALVLISKT